MPQVTLSAGDTAEIYEGERGDVLYMTTDGDLRFSKYEGSAHRGRMVRADNSFEVQLLDDDEEIHVYAVEDATVEWERQGFSISLFERQIVYSPNAQSTRDRTQVYVTGAALLESNDFTSVVDFQNNEGRDLSLEYVSGHAPGGTSDNITFEAEVFEGDGTKKIGVQGYVVNSPVSLDPGLPVAEGETVRIVIANRAATENQVEASAILR